MAVIFVMTHIAVALVGFMIGKVYQKEFDRPIYVPESMPHKGDIPHVHDHDLNK